ncbi:MAG: AAA family ATPase, partial [Gammaproteobacteria bacterium]|nr:AAA family ATPase [Gammaproteobacteria bacterium]
SQTALTLLEYGLLNNVGVSVVTGDAGVGKTTVLLAMQKRAAKKVTVGFVTKEHQVSGELFNWILSQFDLSQPNLQYDEMCRVLKDFLREEHASGRSVLLILDEAHAVKVEALEKLFMLAAEKVEKKPLLQVILSGQPALKKTLNKPVLAQFARRIGVDYHLEPLDAIETCGYIQHRLVLAGAERDVFTPAACGSIHGYSGGNPGLINLLCESALINGCTEKVNLIEAYLIDDMVRNQMQDSALLIANRGNDKEENKQAIAALEIDFPSVKSLKNARATKPRSIVASVVAPKVIKQIETPASNITESAEVSQNVEADIANEDNAIADSELEVSKQNKEKDTPVSIEKSSKPSVEDGDNVVLSIPEKNKEEGTPNPFLYFGIAVGLVVIILIAVAQLFTMEQKTIDLPDESVVVTPVPDRVIRDQVDNPDVVELLEQHEREAERIEQLQLETEALKKERDAVMAKFKEEKQAQQKIVRKYKIDANRVEAKRREARKRLTAVKAKEVKIKTETAKLRLEQARLEEEKRLMQLREDERLVQSSEERQVAAEAAARAEKIAKRKSIDCRGSLAIFKADCR